MSSNEHHERGAWDIFNGFLGVAQTANDFVTKAKGPTPLTGPFKLLGPLGLYNGMDELVNGETWQGKVGGGLEAISGGAGTLELLLGLETAGSVGMVAGAGAAGWKAGTAGNNALAKRGWLGNNEDGSHRNASQWWLDTMMNPATAGSAGPALFAAGGMAVGAALADPVLDFLGIEADMSPKQQRALNNNSQTSFDQMRKTGMSDATAESLASLANPEFHQVREAQQSHATLVKSGLPPAVAQMLTGVSK